MNIKDVKSIVKSLEEEEGDDEQCHIIEKDLWERVLEEIASDRKSDSQTLAKEALKTRDVEFCRWFA